jgi:hypothetical protein
MGVVLALGACRPVATPEPPEPPELGNGPVFIDTVQVVERNGGYWAVVDGFYPDACSTIGGITQEVDGKTIRLTVTSTRPSNVMCAQLLTPMHEEIVLDTTQLASGEYTLIVNDGAQTSFLIS